MEEKSIIRNTFKDIRKKCHDSAKEEIISARILSHEKINSADTVLMYASFGTEINTWNIAESLMRKNIKIAYPKCHKGGIMTFHLIESLSQLDDGGKNSYGICEPCESLSEPEITENTVCIVPGLAFTEKGSRLGYGGGFYDRFLSVNREVYKIALSYESMIAESLPVMPHDISLDCIVTEERTINCNE